MEYALIDSGILHVCGGDPIICIRENQQYLVFSTYVEVIPNDNRLENLEWCILHVCGGDPVVGVPWLSRNSYSPRMWR